MTQRWLCISTRSNDKITRKTKIWGVSTRYKNTILKVRPGDTILMYVMQEVVNKESIPSAITGIYEVISDVFKDEIKIFEIPKNIGNEKFPMRLKLKEITYFKEPIPIKPLIQELTFIKNKKMWSGSIRTAMRPIPEGDYQFIISIGQKVKIV